MKILHIITNTALGGAQKVCIDLCRSAIKEGNSVAVTSMAGGYLWEQLPQEVAKFKLKNMVKQIKMKSDLKVFFELKDVVRQYKPDIIHLHSSKAGVLGRLVAFPYCHRVIYTVHGFDSIRLKYRKFLPLERILQYFCGAIVGVSDYDNKNLKSERIKNNVCTIYNGIEENTIVHATQLPIKTDKRIILTIARISPPKKLQMFLDVARKLPEYDFIWLGGDPEHTTDELPVVYDVPTNAHLLGDIPNASKYIKFCDLFVLFSDFEGLPMTIIEAMSQKKAVVASNVGGIYELIDESNGCLINNNVDYAIEAIKHILSDDDLRLKMEENSYKKYKEKFTLKKMWTDYKVIYEKLICNK